MNKYLQKALHYLGGNIFHNIVKLFFLPIFSHYMIPQEYAIYTNIIIFITFARMFYLLGFNQSLYSYFYKVKTDEYKYTIINSMFISIFVIGSIISLFILFFRDNIAILLLKDLQYSYLFPTVILIIFSEAFFNFSSGIINIMERSKNYVLLGATANILQLLLFTYGAITGRFSVDNVINYVAISSFISMIIAVINIKVILNSLKPEKKVIFSKKLLTPILHFGLIMIPGSLALISMRILDRFMITNLSANGLHDAGIYAVGYKVGAIMQFLVSIVSMVFFPYIMKTAKESNTVDKIKEVYNLYILAGIAFGSFIIMFSNELFYLFVDSNYQSAINLVFVGVVSTFLHGVFNILNLGFYIKEKATKIASAVILGALLNIILNLVLIPKYGVLGAGCASIVAYIFIVVYNFVRGKKVYYVGYNINFTFIAIFVMISLAYLNSFYLLNINVFFAKITFTILTLLLIYLRKKEKIFLLLKNKN